ncbi:syntaxin-71 isoform X2 [Vitis vinifera]|uniref:syntaxin-71 isoform X2 n=1 Tax=Vitis vinifera TaxID=29760 RepID=UPI002882EF8C|nr:syntaxin-71 isoform X2 [Vitis vinifera]
MRSAEDTRSTISTTTMKLWDLNTTSSRPALKPLSSFGIPQKLEAATTEEDRAFDVAMKADVQQTKAYLLEEVSELQKLTLERVNVLSKEEFVAQNDLISMLKERIEAISDGIARGAKQTGGWATSASHEGIKIGSTSDKRFGSNYCQQTEESIRFRQGNEMQKMKQD